MTLYNLVKELIIETTANRNTIMNIMDKKRIASCNYYDEKEPEASGLRFIEIYGYGVSKAGNPVIRVYQLGGDTKTIQPGWKLFRVDRISDLKMLGGTFNEPRKLFNPNGDKEMTKIYNIVKF
jgi:hypothetical protein